MYCLEDFRAHRTHQKDIGLKPEKIKLKFSLVKTMNQVYPFVLLKAGTLRNILGTMCASKRVQISC